MASGGPTGFLPRQRGVLDFVLPEGLKGANGFGGKGTRGGGEVVLDLGGSLGAGDDGGYFRLGEDVAKRGVREGNAGGEESRDVLDQIAAPLDVLLRPARADAGEAAVAPVLAGEPAGIERHLGDQRDAFRVRLLKRGEGGPGERR